MRVFKVIKVAVLLGLLWVLAAGCVEDEKAVVIIANIPPNPDDACSITVQTGETIIYRPMGLLDLSHPFFGTSPEYFLFPQVHNYMPSNISIENATLDAMSIHLTKAVIRYEWLQGRAEVLEADANAASLLDLENESSNATFDFHTEIGAASNDGEPGMAVTIIRIVPPGVGTLLKSNIPSGGVSEVVLGAHVTLQGETFGGTKVSTNEFLYPIRFCLGCLSVSCCEDPDTYFPACMPGQDTNEFLPCDCST